MPFKLEASGFEFEICIFRIEDLNLHEEIIESLLESLADSIEEEGVIRDPVAVDEDTKVVLDGMHRVTAIKMLGYDKIPVCCVDYQDPRVKVGTWSRVFRGLSINSLLDFCKDLGFEVEVCDLGKINEILSDRRFEVILASQDECYSLSRGFDSIKEIYESASEIEKSLKVEGFTPEYRVEEGIPNKLGSEDIALVVPPAKKEEVIDVATSGAMFPHKMTRHVIPARPMRINLPLDYLKEDIQEVDRRLSDRLKEREVEHILPGSIFEGRKYEEELLVFK